MVRGLAFFLFSLLLFFQGLYASAEIEVSLSDEGAFEGRPLQFVIQVSTDRQLSLEEDSFEMEGQPLSVDFSHHQTHSSLTIINGVRESKDLVISYFSLTLPPKQAGNYLLPSVSVKAGKERIFSPKLTYQVLKLAEDKRLSLESFVQPDRDLYPGELFTVGYHLSLHQDLPSIEWGQQDFPLFLLQGATKIGEVESISSLNGPFERRSLSQKMRAQTPGKYDISGGYLSGRPYRRDFFGHRSYGPRLAAKSKEKTLHILPFPQEGKPLHFNGNIGKFSVIAHLKGRGELLIGDKLTLVLEVFDAQYLEAIKLPDFHLLKAFKQHFRFNEFLADEKLLKDRKIFTVEMRPLDTQISAVPPIPFSYFDPDSSQYHSFQTQAIPITVKEAAPFLSSPEIKSQKESQKDIQPLLSKSSNGANIAIYASVPLKQPLLQHLRFFPVLGAALLLCLLYFFIDKARGAFHKRGVQKKNADAFFKEALKHQKDPTLFFALYEKAIFMKLWEKGLCATPDLTLQDLENKGLCLEVKTFFQKLDAWRYSGALEQEEEMVEMALALYRSIS